VDKFDRAIIDLLTQNARLSLSQIGREIGLSRTSVAERVQRLEDNKFIEAYTIKLGEASSPTVVSAYFQMTFSPFKLERLQPSIAAISEIKHCQALSGEIDLIAYIETQSMGRLNQVRGQLEQLPDLQRLITCPVLEKVK